jgi:hypothetical protein
MLRLDRPYRTRQIGNRQAVIGEITGEGKSAINLLDTLSLSSHELMRQLSPPCSSVR